MNEAPYTQREPAAGEAEAEAAVPTYDTAVLMRTYIGYCSDCGPLSAIIVNPELIGVDYATEKTGWFFRCSKREVDKMSYELRGTLEADRDIIFDDHVTRAKDLPLDLEFWSRQICGRLHKHPTATCPACGLDADILLHDDDYFVLSTGTKCTVREMKKA